MPIRFGDLCKRSSTDNKDDNLLTNPITISILIVIIMVLLAVFSFRMCDCSNKYKNIISFAVYGILATTALLFIHNNAILKIYNKRSSSDDARTLFNTDIPTSITRTPDIFNPLETRGRVDGQGEENSLDKFMSELE